ncbi:hypothetical protein D3C81_1568460 [compost metagenome]
MEQFQRRGLVPDLHSRLAHDTPHQLHIFGAMQMSAQRIAVLILRKRIAPLLDLGQILLHLIQYAVNPGVLRQVAACPEPGLHRRIAQLSYRRNDQQCRSARSRGSACSEIAFVGQNHLRSLCCCIPCRPCPGRASAQHKHIRCNLLLLRHLISSQTVD